MNELTRMQYLDAMGIDMFVPKVSLPQAKASPQCVLPSVETLPVASNESSLGIIERLNVDEQATHSSSVSAANVLANLRNERDEKPQAEPVIGSEDVPIAGQTVHRVDDDVLPSPLSALTPKLISVNFTLGMWRIGPHLQILDSRMDGDALPTDVLLRNMLRVHGLLTEPMPAQEILHWPLPGVALTDTSWGAAHDMVISFLEGRLLDNPVTAFLVFGEDAFHALMGEAVIFSESLYQIVSMDAFAADAIVLPSLRSLLHNPLEKKQLWSILQRLSHQITQLCEPQT